jgi:putative ABC transport system ATP-binding protein
MNPPLLSAKSLGRRIGTRWLWRHLDLDLAGGEALAVTGPSGSGKTLLLRSLAGLEPATEGEIAAAGRALETWPMPAYRARVTYVAQRAFTLEGTVEDALRRPFRFGVHRAKPFPRERALQGLRAVGRDEGFLNFAGASLSGGEGQIVALLRALLLDPLVLLLDEPTASLDADAVRAVEALVTGWLAANDSRAMVWTSHQDAQLDRVTNRRLHLGGPA